MPERSRKLQPANIGELETIAKQILLVCCGSATMLRILFDDRVRALASHEMRSTQRMPKGLGYTPRKPKEELRRIG